MKTFVEEFLFWSRVIGLWCLAAMLTWRWLRTRSISKGHSVWGEIAVFSAWFLWATLAFATHYAYLFYPVFTITTAIWLGYDNWFFADPAPYEAVLKQSRASSGLFWNDTRLAMYFKGESVTRTTEWLTWKNAAIAGAILLPIALLFGFSRVVKFIALNDQIKVKAEQTNQIKTRQAVETAVRSATMAVANAVDTLYKGQATIMAVVDSNHDSEQVERGKIADALIKQNEKQNRKLNQLGTSMERTRLAPTPSPIAPRSTLIPPDPARVKPVVTPPPKKKFLGIFGATDADDLTPRQSDTLSLTSQNRPTHEPVRRD